MTRKYELKRRAERQAETRRRIVAAAVELHRTKGPARTTLSDVARLADVERHTLYRHFPDERQLFQACSGLFFDENPPPDPAKWRELADPDARLRRGLALIYAWYEQVEDMLTCVMRDLGVHALTRETFEQQALPALLTLRGALAEGLPETRAVQAALDLALDFNTWKRLSGSGLANDEAAQLMARAIRCQ